MEKYFRLFLLNIFLLLACYSQTPQPTQLLNPSQTASPAMTLIPQLTKTPTPTLDPDQIATATLQAISRGCTLGSELSPNKEWVAIKCGDVKINEYDEASTALKIVNLNSYQEWVITYYQIYGAKEIESVGGMSNGTIFVEQWSVDKNYLYIGVMPNVFTEFEFNRTAALFRLNLITGEVIEILEPGEIQETFYDYSISPDEKSIAFITLLKNPLLLNIKDIDSTKTQSLQLDTKFSTAGSIVWAQDNEDLIFLAVDFNDNPPYITTILFQWDSQEKKLIEICQLFDRLFFIVSWDEKNKRVTLRDYFEEKFFELNITNGELTPVSP